MNGMTVFDRRRAERFAQLLDEADGGHRHHTRTGADDELAKLVEVGRRLKPIDVSATPGSTFKRDLRAMLIAEAERDGIGVTAQRGPSPTRSAAASQPVRARGAVVVGIAAGALALSGVSMASGDAVPGDALYGMKRSTEQAQLALTGSDLGRGQLYLEFARTRLREAREVRGDSASLAEALRGMDEDTRLGVRMLTGAAWDDQNGQPLDTVDRFAQDQRILIDQMRRLSGRAAYDEFAASLALLDSVRERSEAIRAALACDAGAGDADVLGPVPGRC